MCYLDIARWLLDRGAEVNARAGRGTDDLDDEDPDHLGATPLMLIENRLFGQPRKLVDLILEAGADINAIDSFGQNVVHRVVESHKLLKHVLNRGADPNVRAHNGDTQLMRAALMERKRAVSILRKAGASEDGLLDVYLLNACYADKRDEIEEYLDKGADVNFQRLGTPLCAATDRGDLELAQRLLDAGADIDLPITDSPHGDSNPLLSAAYDGQLEVVRFLLDAGADVNVSHDGYSALDYAKLGKAEGRKPDRPWDEVPALLRDAGKRISPSLRGRLVKKGAFEAVDALNAIMPAPAKWSRFTANDAEIIESNRIDDIEFLIKKLPDMQALARNHGFSLALIGHSLDDIEPRLSILSRDFAAAAETSAANIFDAWEAERSGDQSDDRDPDEEADAYDWSYRQNVLAELKDIPERSSDARLALDPGHLVLSAGGVSPIPIMYQFGGWNSAPYPVEMGLVLQHWADIYGAELISIGRDTVTVRLEHPLTTIEDVRAAAREIGLFCDESESAEDDIRMATGNFWSFWWD
jgi:ankyrin repeat protein